VSLSSRTSTQHAVLDCLVGLFFSSLFYSRKGSSPFQVSELLSVLAFHKPHVISSQLYIAKRTMHVVLDVENS
jgi:hypothetical protein